jgi:hypothetical protein
MGEHMSKPIPDLIEEMENMAKLHPQMLWAQTMGEGAAAMRRMAEMLKRLATAAGKQE